MTEVTGSSKSSRYDEILDSAQSFIQTRGYNGFSYRDIATAVGIKSASIHYHFPAKSDLGQAVAARYCDHFSLLLRKITQGSTSAKLMLESYTRLFRDTLVERKKLCLCGVLAGEVETLPEAVRQEIVRFFDQQEAWLTKTIQSGIDSGEILIGVDANRWATTLLSSLEGGMLVAKSLGNYQNFDIVAESLLDMLFATDLQAGSDLRVG
ncbi:MAG: TetR/AcrR family transcriptional regulator [Cyanobacteria bacterium J06632_3]